MKSFLFILLFLLTISATNAQYYYKDIIGTKETSELIKNYRNNKVSKVVLNSYDADNTRSDDFFVEQTFSAADQTLTTTTRSGISGESILISYVNANGNVIKTIDSSATNKSVTAYGYNASGDLESVVSNSTDSSGKFIETEEHRWQYNAGKVTGMIRIRDKRDTSYVNFQADENGNITEERSTRKGVTSDPVYYYYDKNNRLTDIVRYSPKAKRLLAEYMFEYSPANQVIQKITVPSNNSEYLIWRYQYNDKGLKIKEAVFDKRKQLTGKIEYLYQFGS